MKKLLYILLLVGCAATAQPRFFRQSDNTIHFGANLQGLSSANEITMVKDSLKFKYIRDAITLITYSGGVDAGLQSKYNAGLRVICDINWTSGGGLAKDFPTGATLTTYRSQLTSFLANNKQFIWLCVIENEPYNGVYWNYDDHAPFMVVSDYINELSAAITICHAVNMKVADGCTHLNYYSDMITPPITNAAAKRADTAFNYYATLNLDWINYHFTSPSNLGTSSSMDADIIKTLTDYGISRTGINYISNEWHQEADGTSPDEDAFAASVVNRTRQAHIRIALVFGGNGVVDALPLVDNGTLKLTSLGRAYRDAVTPPILQ